MEVATFSELAEAMEANEDGAEEMMESLLRQVLEARADEEGEANLRVSTYAEQAIMTHDRGLVVRVGRGEFQITIVRSR